MIRKIKNFIQRGFRGYSDEDVWSVDWYLASIIPPMLRDVAKYSVSYHPTLESMKEWQEILHRIADGFEKYRTDCVEINERTKEDEKEWKIVQKKFFKYFGAYWT